MNIIPYGRQEITQEDIDSVAAVLRSDFLTQGPMVPKFEREVANFCGASHALAVNSATSALHIACLALDLGPGDWLWTSTTSFVASANCGLYCGAKVDFVDIDPRTYNICPNALAKKLSQARIEGRLPKIVVSVHLCGQSCDMAAIAAMSKEYGFKIIEDASHAIGGYYRGEPIGSCSYSDITVLSFHPVKIITTAEGGMLLTNSNELATKLGLLRSHGITRDPSQMTQPMDGPWYYQQVTLGFNYRLTDVQAALGLSQMTRLTKYVQRRHEIAKRYNELLGGLPIILPWQNPEAFSAYHLYVIRLQLEKINRTHLQVFEKLRAKDILVNLHYMPIHTQPYYKKMGFKQGDYPEAESYYREAISIPMYPALTDFEQDYVVNALREVLEA